MEEFAHNPCTYSKRLSGKSYGIFLAEFLGNFQENSSKQAI